MNAKLIGPLFASILLLTAATAAAQTGTALEFDGDDYVYVADPVDLRGPMTVEAWIRPDAADGGRLFSNRLGGGYEMDISSSERLRFTTNGMVNVSYDVSDRLGTWFHIAVTWAGPADGTLKLYLDGEVAIQTYLTTPTEAPAPDFWIGSQPDGWNPFTGAIDELRLFSAVLDEATIAVWHTRGIDSSHPAHAHLEASWGFEEGAGQAAASSGPVSGRDGVLGATAGNDASDPTWIGSGMTASEALSWGEIKGLFE